jgi:hypothetical protein
MATILSEQTGSTGNGFQERRDMQLESPAAMKMVQQNDMREPIEILKTLLKILTVPLTPIPLPL